MNSMLTIFIAVFFGVSATALVISLVRGSDANLSKSCRRASWMAFAIGLILLYLQFVLT